MNIYFHTDQLAIQDYSYDFSIGNYHRLPIRANGILRLIDTYKSYIKTNSNYSHNICAEVKHIVKKNVETSVVNTKEVEYNEYGLVIFEIFTYEPIHQHLYFFMEFTDYDGVSVDKQIDVFKINQYYQGDIEFYLDAGLIETIVHGLWNDLVKPSDIYSKVSPFAITRVEHIFTNDGLLLNNINDMDEVSYIIDVKYICQDELIQYTLDYYEVDNKIEMKNFGSFYFGFMHLYMKDCPEYIAQIGQQTLILTEIFDTENFKYAVENIQNNIWIDDGYAISADYEDKSFSFCKVNLPICGWDEDNEINYDILVRYTAPNENAISTMTNLEELEKFVSWNSEIEKKYEKLITIAENNNYKFTWK